MKFLTYLLLMVVLMSGCVADKIKISSADSKKSNSTKSSKISVSSVKIINHQLIVDGLNLDSVETVKVNGQSFTEAFSIEAKTGTRIIANSIRGFSFDVSKVFDLILSSANASATFQIDFNLCNATLYGKGFDCVGVNTIQDKDVLTYDAVSNKWVPKALNNLSYQGTLDASGSLPIAGPAGEYYIISVAGNGFGVGDWAISNGTTFDQINNSTTVTKVFTRTGDIVPVKGDYNLNLLGDVVLPTMTGAHTGKVLKYNGTNWVPGDDLTGGGAGSVVTSTIANSAVTDAKIDTVSASKITGTINSSQILDGSIVNADISATAAIAYSKINIPNTSIPYSKLDIQDGDIPAAKISGLTSGASVLTTTITDGDSTHAPDGNAVFDALGLKLNLSGGALSPGATITGLPAIALAGSEATSKDYVDNRDALKVSKTGDTMTGALTLDSSLLMKGGTNYVTLKAHATTAVYDFVFPQTKGTNGYALITDGNGNTSWSAVSDSSVQGFAKSALPTCSTGEVLKSNGTAFSCVTDSTGGGAFTGTASRAIVTGTGGALEVSSTTAAEIGYVNGVTSSIQTQLNSKEASIATGSSAQYYRGDKSWQTLDTDAIAEGVKQFFTVARAKAAAVANSITSSVTDVAPSQKAVYDALALKLGTTGGILTMGTISGVPTPTNADDVSNKNYVDTRISYSAGLGNMIPANARMLMKTCPAGWTTSGSTSASGPGKVTCGGSSGTDCAICENGSTASPLPANSIVLMEQCPSGWSALGAGTSLGQASRANGSRYISCQSPTVESTVPQNSRFMMATCPASWKDIGGTGLGAQAATCDSASCRVCETPGPGIPIHITPAVPDAAGEGLPLYLYGGAGGATSGNGGWIHLLAGATTSGDGGSISIGASSGAGNGYGGNVNINSGVAAGTGVNGSIILNSGTGNVGIGQVSPGEKLEVNGNIKISNGSGGGIKFADGTTQTTAASGGGGTVIEPKCGFYSSTCTPDACPTGWSDLGITNGVNIFVGQYFGGYNSRYCEIATTYKVIEPKCPYYSSACTPPSCPTGWTDLGITNSYYYFAGQYFGGYYSRFCVK